jgi:hypothetical protein
MYRVRWEAAGKTFLNFLRDRDRGPLGGQNSRFAGVFFVLQRKDGCGTATAA